MTTSHETHPTLLAALLLAPLAALHAANATKPNVLFILADALGWGDLCCYGNPVVDTPSLDALAQQGVWLTARAGRLLWPVPVSSWHDSHAQRRECCRVRDLRVNWLWPRRSIFFNSGDELVRTLAVLLRSILMSVNS